MGLLRLALSQLHVSCVGVLALPTLFALGCSSSVVENCRQHDGDPTACHSGCEYVDPHHCRLRCVDDEDCPSGSSCRPAAAVTQLDAYVETHVCLYDSDLR